MSDNNADEQTLNNIRGLELRLVDAKSGLPLSRSLRSTFLSKNGAMRREWNVVARSDQYFAIELLVKSTFEWTDANALELSLGFDTGTEVYEQSVYFLRPDLESTRDLLNTLNLIFMVQTDFGYRGRLDHLLKSKDLRRSGTDVKAYFKFIHLRPDAKKAPKAVDVNQGRIRTWVERRVMGKPERTRDMDYLIDPVVAKPRAQRDKIISNGLTLEASLDFRQNLAPKVLKNGFCRRDCTGAHSSERFNFLFFYKEEDWTMNRVTTTMDDHDVSGSALSDTAEQDANLMLASNVPVLQGLDGSLLTSTPISRKSRSNSALEIQNNGTITVHVPRKTSTKRKRSESNYSPSSPLSSLCSPPSKNRAAHGRELPEGPVDAEESGDAQLEQKIAERGSPSSGMSFDMQPKSWSSPDTGIGTQASKHNSIGTGERASISKQNHKTPVLNAKQVQHHNVNLPNLKAQSDVIRQQDSEPARQSLELESMITGQQCLIEKFDEVTEKINNSLRTFRKALMKHQEDLCTFHDQHRIEMKVDGGKVANTENNVLKCASVHDAEELQISTAQGTAVDKFDTVRSVVHDENHDVDIQSSLSEEVRGRSSQQSEDPRLRTLSAAAENDEVVHSSPLFGDATHRATVGRVTSPISISSNEDLQHGYNDNTLTVSVASMPAPNQAETRTTDAEIFDECTKNKMGIARILN